MPSLRQPAVYILASKPYGTLYTGVTSELAIRIHKHKESILDGFSSKYSCKLLVYYEAHPNMESAIQREKKIKAGSRAKKLQLIQNTNSNWDDLYETIV